MVIKRSDLDFIVQYLLRAHYTHRWGSRCWGVNLKIRELFVGIIFTIEQKSSR